jgi:hypothetical protein
MKVTIDEARVGKQPVLKIDGIELANIVNGYTLHHDAGQPATLELRIAFGADLSEIEALLENPNVKIIMPEEEPNVESTCDRIVSAIIRRLFKPKYHVERVERYQLPGRLRIVKWCAAPADAPEDELRRIFSIVDEPQCDDMVVWFYSSLEDIGRKPFDVALLERSGKDAWPTIRRPT